MRKKNKKDLQIVIQPIDKNKVEQYSIFRVQGRDLFQRIEEEITIATIDMEV